MKKITDLMLKLNEIDFKTHGAYKRYKTKHKMRPTTKVTIGGKTTTEPGIISSELGAPFTTGRNSSLTGTVASFALK